MPPAHIEITEFGQCRRGEAIQVGVEFDAAHVEILTIADEHVGLGAFHGERSAFILGDVRLRPFQLLLMKHRAGRRIQRKHRDAAVEKRGTA